MKKILFLFAFVFILSLETYAQEGIQFVETSWEEVLQQAADENKVIFMDAYAEWCGPCKMMSRDVFPDAEVGMYYNKHFVNVKIDMEKGEGVALAEQYGVQAYPTLLYIDSKGGLVHRAVGYHATDAFLELGSLASDPKQSLAGLQKRYLSGDRDAEFLLAYTTTLYDAMDDRAGRVAQTYLETQSDWSTQENMEFIFRFASDYSSRPFQYMLENREAFEQMAGQDMFQRKVQGAIYQSIDFEQPAEVVFQKVHDAYAAVYPEDAAGFVSYFKMSYYLQQGEVDQYATTAAEYYDGTSGHEWSELNQVAWSFYERVEDKKLLKRAKAWAEQSIEIDRNYYNMDTLAALYFKLGKKGKARKAAKEAIELAKASGEDPSATEELLREIDGRE